MKTDLLETDLEWNVLFPDYPGISWMRALPHILALW